MSDGATAIHGTGIKRAHDLWRGPLGPNTDVDLAACSPREQALAEFAVQLTNHPASITSTATDALRVHPAGLGDRGIHDLVNVVAYMNYANRIVAGLGVGSHDFFLKRVD